MNTRIYNSLRVFVSVAQHMSISGSADAMNMTKGAVSYQIKQLERDLGFDVFERRNGKIFLSSRGTTLLEVAKQSYSKIDSTIGRLKNNGNSSQITIGMTTYFASRWLAPRLMRFTSNNQDVSIRIQPTIGLVDLATSGIDLEVRWGFGQWDDLETELLFQCPAFATAGGDLIEEINLQGLHNSMNLMTLLHDFQGSVAWSHWFKNSGIPYNEGKSDLIISDPNVRVEAVINNQGLAINDSLVQIELDRKQLFRVSDCTLDQYGYYLAYSGEASHSKALSRFRDWMVNEGKNWNNVVSNKK